MRVTKKTTLIVLVIPFSRQHVLWHRWPASVANLLRTLSIVSGERSAEKKKSKNFQVQLLHTVWGSLMLHLHCLRKEYEHR